jgi:thiamine-phosphate pyrophosphorylase
MSETLRGLPLFKQQVYFITDTEISGLSHVEQVEELMAAGAALIQLRDKNSNSRDFFQAAAKAVEVAHRAGSLIIINDRVDIAVASGADGVHLGQNDLPASDARAILGSRSIIGLSTHSLHQAAAALKEPVDYIAIGPVFHTSTKADLNPAVGVEGVAGVRQTIGNMPLVAIGGINKINVLEVLAAGADSAAVIRASLHPPDTIAANTRDLLANV